MNATAKRPRSAASAIQAPAVATRAAAPAAKKARRAPALASAVPSPMATVAPDDDAAPHHGVVPAISAELAVPDLETLLSGPSQFWQACWSSGLQIQVDSWQACMAQTQAMMRAWHQFITGMAWPDPLTDRSLWWAMANLPQSLFSDAQV